MAPTPQDNKGSHWWRIGILAALLLCALALRLYGIDWDQGHHFHPDERFLLLFKIPELHWPGQDLGLLFDPARSPWNPRWFAYGSSPLYQLYLLYQAALALDPSFTLDSLRFLGRGLSALFDVGSIALIYLLGRRLYDWRTGLLATAFATFAVVHIQLSHFATFDVQLTFWTLVALYGAARVMDRGDLWGTCLAGAGLGLGLATKTTILPLVIPVSLAYLFYGAFSQDATNRSPQSDAERSPRALRGLVAAGAIAALLFILAQPYALLDWPTFIRDVREQTETAMRLRDYPYTRQYENTLPYLYHIQQLTVWGLGLPLGLLNWLALAITCVRAVRLPSKSDLLLLSWALPYFLLVGATPVKYLRYMLPLTPILFLMGARLLILWWDAARSAPDTPSGEGGSASPLPPGPLQRLTAFLRRQLLPGIVTGGVLAASVWYALAFTNIYREPHPATRLSAWINQNVPQGSLILQEHWTEGIPRLESYRKDELQLYEPDNPGKLEQLIRQLESGDYIAFFSNRLYGSISRLPERYPLTNHYYRLLLSGQLGYQLVHTTAVYPSLLGVTLKDDPFSRSSLPKPERLEQLDGLVLTPGYADESFTGYDHPMTMLFKKEQALSGQELRSLLKPGLASLTPASPQEGPLLTPNVLQAQRAGGAWSQLFQQDSWPNQHPWLTWLLTIELLGLLAFPLAFWLFPSFPDRGFLLAKGLGLLLVTYGCWLVANLQLLPFTRSTIGLGAALLALVGALLFFKQREAILQTVASRWRFLLTLEGLFLGAFFAFYLIRLANPDLWHPWRGGEKPMDFAYLNAVVKSTYMPAYDPWYSGGALNYYYYGQVLVATVIKLTGILPEIAYNLAIPTLFALTVGHAASLGSALLAAQAPGRGRYGLLLTGGVTAGLGIALLGNLDGAGQVLRGLQKASGIVFESTLPGIEGAVQTVVGIARVLTQSAPFPAFDYWNSRSLGGMDSGFIDPTLRAPSISITEFPFFTFLFADLHAHLIALPLTILAAAFAFQAALWSQTGRLLQRLCFLAAFGLLLGAIRWSNTWDYPTYLALGIAGILISEAAQKRAWGRGRAASAGVQALVLLGCSILFFRLFDATNQTFYRGGLLPSPETTPFFLYVRIHGLFLAILLGFVGFELAQRFGKTGLLRLMRAVVRRPSQALRVLSLVQRLARQPGPASYLVIAGLLLLAGLAGVLALLGAATVGFLLLLLTALLLLAWRELTAPTERGGAYLFALALAASAAALSLVVDVVKLDIPGEVQRMNNVFKLYFQVWTLYALSATYALWWVLGHGQTQGPATPPMALSGRGWPPGWRRAWLGLVGALTLAALVYPLLATPQRISDRFEETASLRLTNNGMAFMETALYRDEKGSIELEWDYRAILWLREQVQGSPVILEAVTPIYRWGSRVSIYTGLPTVLGWDWHQTQQRWDYRLSIEQRKRDVTALYTTTSTAEATALLQRYQVEYVYVGQLERLYYPAEGLHKFGTMVDQGLLQAVYKNPQVTIYQVKAN